MNVSCARCQLASLQQVAFRQDSDQTSGVIDDQQRADAILEHQGACLGDRRRRIDPDDPGGHDIAHVHVYSLTAISFMRATKVAAEASNDRFSHLDSDQPPAETTRSAPWRILQRVPKLFRHAGLLNGDKLKPPLAEPAALVGKLLQMSAQISIGRPT